MSWCGPANRKPAAMGCAMMGVGGSLLWDGLWERLCGVITHGGLPGNKMACRANHENRPFSPISGPIPFIPHISASPGATFDPLSYLTLKPANVPRRQPQRLQEIRVPHHPVKMGTADASQLRNLFSSQQYGRRHLVFHLLAEFTRYRRTEAEFPRK